MPKLPTHVLLGAALLALAQPVLAEPQPIALGANADSANPAADAMFKEPYVDVDEWRDAPVRHRYVHGGFKGTDMRFSFYLPPKEQFQGRFFQYVTPVPDSENLSQTAQAGDNNIGFAAASGAIFVETNGGGKGATAGPAFMADPTIGAFRANAAAARYVRVLASEMYGPQRIHGYIFGGSGGGFRTLGSMENTEGVWDGAVPFVLGSPMAAPNSFTIRMHAMRVLKDKFPQIIDAVDAGGSGDPYAGLNAEEAEALREATRMGFPPNSWFGYKDMGVHGFTALYQGVVMGDPTYFEHFWTKPGYLGFNPPDSLAKARLQFSTTIKAPLSRSQMEARGAGPARIAGTPRDTGRGTADLAWQALVSDGSERPAAFELAQTPPDVGFLGGDMFVLSGEAKGKRVALVALNGAVASLGVVDLATIAKLRPGDQVRVDNSNFLAAQTFHRHQVPDASYPVYDQFRGPDGKPLYPQRPRLLGPQFAAGAAGKVPSGHFNGKIIVVGSLLDREAVPWNSDWYRRRFDEIYGKEAQNKYRLWFTENALHGHSEDLGAATRVVTYLPVLQQALRDVAAWVEKGVAPPATTNYRLVDGQVIVAPTAAARRGIQPVVTLRANGGVRAEVAARQPVRFTGTITAPPGTGTVIKAEWDFDGSGTFAQSSPVSGKAGTATVTTRHSFASPGTYFAVLRGYSQRKDAAGTPFAQVRNLARARVVVK